jgi:spore coat polysaccharide biosynthesis predicted glycosyltransferase SpsG
VLDGYHFDYGYQRRLADGRCLLVVDDVGHLPRYAGSLLLNSSVNAEEICYTQAPQRRLLGTKYALLRREFVEARSFPRVGAKNIDRVLVSLGGADAANDTIRVLHALLNTTPRPPSVEVVIGPLSPHAAALEEFARSHPGITARLDPSSMCDELLRADFVIASAGTISAELACLGKPALLLAVADNQLGIGAGMARAGASIYGGDIRTMDIVSLTTIIEEALADRDLHESMRESGPRLVDGLGGVRICDVLSGAAND